MYCFCGEACAIYRHRLTRVFMYILFLQGEHPAPSQPEKRKKKLFQNTSMLDESSMGIVQYC
ncbi:uncharacterized protein ASCRUDRAFT_103850 [Ascoidea rubescens DSM 1968]|uniref:Uncharacterized protein n=1 Tax=Ascoidea rubescens DSM 1968 TaxID=1344418 RepID=A0A1D2VRL4_9ASCO|nr:hypothetical protein ASCRUDRAFT_103850 [Ascoidea rubescens DSM 1968]ODV64253.1 hypothetical protein ASCRUDRAFT_103850 [Ascoidea rubescens DSM 1968]